jgi:hypothetical protein
MIPRALAAVNNALKPSQDTRDRLQAVRTLGTIMRWAEMGTDEIGEGARNNKGKLTMRGRASIAPIARSVRGTPFSFR